MDKIMKRLSNLLSVKSLVTLQFLPHELVGLYFTEV